MRLVPIGEVARCPCCPLFTLHAGPPVHRFTCPATQERLGGTRPPSSSSSHPSSSVLCAPVSCPLLRIRLRGHPSPGLRQVSANSRPVCRLSLGGSRSLSPNVQPCGEDALALAQGAAAGGVETLWGTPAESEAADAAMRWCRHQTALDAAQAALHVAQVVLELSHPGLELTAQLLEGVLPLREQLDQLLPARLSGAVDPRDRMALPRVRETRKRWRSGRIAVATAPACAMHTVTVEAARTYRPRQGWGYNRWRKRRARIS